VEDMMQLSKSTLTVFAGVATAAATASVIFFAQSCPCEKLTLAKEVVLGGWVLGPPVWFFLQWAYFAPDTKEEVATFKYSQALASKVWLALVSVLYVLSHIKAA
jgi:hypothetical protein